MIIVEDIIKNIVSRINQKPQNMETYYHFGTIREIVGSLNQLTNSGSKKYPLIALIEPFQTIVNEDGINANIRILIATYTMRNMKSVERLEENYKKILFPIYTDFMDELVKSSGSSTINHTFINHFEMGREALTGYDGTLLNDHVDVLEIRDMNVYFRKKNKCINNKKISNGKRN